jgi:hypothetical protein
MPYYVSPPILSKGVRVRTTVVGEKGPIFGTEILHIFVILSVVFI